MRSHLVRRWRWPVLLTALALALAACGADEEPTEEPDTDVEDTDDVEEEPEEVEDEEPADAADGGTVLFGDEQEPTILNGFLIDGNSLVTSKVFNNQFPGAYVIQPDLSLAPYVIDGEAEFTEDPFSVTYTILDEAEWSDGTTISVDDFIYTYETIMAEDADWADQITSRAGYELIEDFEVDGDKTITFNFTEPYAPWQLLFANVLPAHVLEGSDFTTVLNDELPDVSGGPFVFDEWDRGTQLRMVRNDAYWGGEVALDEIILRYGSDADQLTDQLLAGAIDMYDAHPTAELVQRLRGDASIEVDVGQWPVWKHATINTLVPGLDRAYVRQAMALGIDRDAMAQAILGDIDPAEQRISPAPTCPTTSRRSPPALQPYDDPHRAPAT